MSRLFALRRTKFGVLGSPLVLSLLVGVLVTCMIVGLRRGGYLELWELKAYDWMLRNPQARVQPESRIVLIGITEQDVQALGSWPLTDAVLAKLLQVLLSYEPRTIGVDIYRNFQVPPGHEALEPLLTAHANVIMVTKFGGEGVTSVPPLPVLQGTDQVGFNDLLVDADGIVRRGLLFLDDGQQTAYSFALRLALNYLRAQGIVSVPDPGNPDHLRLGSTTLPPLQSDEGGYVDLDDRGYQFLLDFDAAVESLPSYPVTDILAGRIEPGTLKDKILLIGVTAESVPDLFYTPYQSSFGTDQRGMYGVQLHAQIVGQLLRAALQGVAPRQSLGETSEVLWILVWGLLGGAVGTLGRSTWRFSLYLTGSLLALGVIAYAAFAAGWWIPVVPPAAAFVLSAALLTAAIASLEQRERAVLMQLFKRHVSPEVAETVWKQRDQFWDGGRPRSQKVTITVLFSDLEGFTLASEQTEPQLLMEWMNTYVETMASQVMRHGGVVDDYFGDAIKANFGVPLPRMTEAGIAEDARRAVECALAMEAEMRRLNQRWKAQGLPAARMRIGIFTGQAVAGSLGSADRLKYTTIGDTVNIAARLESFNKDEWKFEGEEHPCRILLGESTVKYVGANYATHRLGELNLKGKQDRVAVYRLMGPRETSSHTTMIRAGG